MNAGCHIPGTHAVNSMIVQTFIFDKYHCYRADVISWLKKHHYRTGLDEKSGTYRARQVDPGCFRKNSFRTIMITTGVKAVVGKLKS
jgi:hypothetical protein